MEKQLSFFDLIHSKSAKTKSNEKLKPEILKKQSSRISSLNNQEKN